jgi:hypothetical protein
VGATIGEVVCTGATLAGSADDALTLDRCRIAGNVHLDDKFSATGSIRLVGATVDGSVICTDATISGHPDAFIATSSQIGMWLTFQRSQLRGRVSLIGTRTPGLIDDLGAGDPALGSWAEAEPLEITGFEYARFLGDATWEPDKRFEWLKHTEHFDSQAWHHLADVYHVAGRDGDAQRTAIEGEHDRLDRGGLSGPRRLGRRLLGITIGHGYRPWRAGGWALAFIVAFAIFVSLDRSAFEPDKAGVHGHPSPALIYAADTFIPIVDLGEADKWAPTGGARWAEWPIIVIGWTLSTLFVAGFTSVVRT